MPTGSLAPDSPSSRVPVRPATSRRPSTEKTTAGSVGASAVPTSRAARQPKPKSACASTASTPAVTKVPATPSHTTPPATGRKRASPMCMPPSKRIRTRATVTIRWSARIDSEPRAGNRSAQTDAATRKIAGVGMRTHSLIRLEPTAASSARAATTTTSANGATSCTWAPGVGDRSADQTSRHSAAHCIGSRPTLIRRTQVLSCAPTQRFAQGRASSRAAGIGSPQTSHVP